MKENTIIQEITPLKETDVFYIADRKKMEFDYPLHIHSEVELNFVQGGKGVTRIVGDSKEEIEDYDLVLIANKDLIHAWTQGSAKTDNIREITIQFNLDFDNDPLLQTNPFQDIRNMMKRARHGLVFPIKAIIEVYSLIDTLGQKEDSLEAVTQLLTILHKLALCKESRTLASSNYNTPPDCDSKVILKVKKYIEENYGEEIRLNDVASLANMSISSFARFFKLHTGVTLQDYLIDVRLGHVIRMLIDSNESIANISFFCGFNNLSNFNRIFLSRKGCTPSYFRKNYRKKSFIV